MLELIGTESVRLLQCACDDTTTPYYSSVLAAKAKAALSAAFVTRNT